MTTRSVLARLVGIGLCLVALHSGASLLFGFAMLGIRALGEEYYFVIGGAGHPVKAWVMVLLAVVPGVVGGYLVTTGSFRTRRLPKKTGAN